MNISINTIQELPASRFGEATNLIARKQAQLEAS